MTDSTIDPVMDPVIGPIIGVDIGGTKIAAARVCPQTHAVENLQHTATPQTAKDFVHAIKTLLSKLIDSAPDKSMSNKPVAIGIATAGIVDPVRGEILGSTGNLPALKGIPSLKHTLEEATGLPVSMENDANAAAYGEFKAGAAKGSTHALMITLGTGVGGGMVFNGKLYHGKHFAAGEVGHIAISQAHERLCTCGKWDCWETFGSGTGVAETARRMLRNTPNAEFSPMMTGLQSVEQVTTHDVIRALRQSDALAKQVMDAWHAHVALGLGSLINVLDPEVVVVGGGMAQFVDFVQLNTLTQARAMVPHIRLVPAELANQAGLMGAAFLALERLLDRLP